VKTRWKISPGPNDVPVLEPAAEGEPLQAALQRVERSAFVIDLRAVDPSDKQCVTTREEALRWGDLQRRLQAHPQRVTALVSGYLAGPAASLALACNAVVAGLDTRLHFPEVSEGLIPPGETLWLLVERCSLAEALALLVRGQALDVRQARERGLVDAAGPEDTLPFLAASVRPRPSKAPDRVLGSSLGRFLVKRQALSELAGRNASRAARTAVRVFFEYYRAGTRKRIEAIASAIEQLAGDPQRPLLKRMAELRKRFQREGGKPPRRALVIAGEEGWRWACLFAHYGTMTRWVWTQEQILADGLCWLRRDTERYFPDRLDQILRCVTASTCVCGFAGRDLVVASDLDLIPRDTLRELKREGKLVVTGKALEEFPCIEVPCDPLTSRVCRVSNASPGLCSLLEALGYLILPEREAEAVFAAARAFHDAWNHMVRAEGLRPASLIASLKQYGCAVRELMRRYRVVGRLPRASEAGALRLLEAMRGALQGAGGDRDLIEFALHLEFGLPAHRGGLLPD